MKRDEQTHVVEIAVLDLLDPAERVLHTGEVVFRRIGKETVGVIVVDHTEHILLVVLTCASARLVVRKVFLVQDTESTSKTVGILANAENRVMVLRVTRPPRCYLRKIVEARMLAPGKDLAYRVQRSSRSTGENDRILRRRGLEVLQNPLTHILHLRVTGNVRTYSVLGVQTRGASAVGIAIQSVQEEITALLDLGLTVQSRTRVVKVNRAMQTLHIVFANGIDRSIVSVVIAKAVHKVLELGSTEFIRHHLIAQEGWQVFKIDRIGTEKCKER